MKSKVKKLYAIEKISIPSEICTWKVGQEEIKAKLEALSLEYASDSLCDTVMKGDCVFCRSERNRSFSDRTILLYPNRSIPEAEKAEEAIIGKKSGSQVKTTLAGIDVVLTIEKIVRRLPAAIDDELILKLAIDGVKTLVDYEEYYKNKQEENNKVNATHNIVSYLIQELIEHSEYDIDTDDMNEWTSKRAAKYFEYMLEEGEDPRLPEEGFDILTDEEAIAKIAGNLEPEYKELLVCLALCEEKGIHFSKDDVQADIKEYQESGEFDFVDEEEMLMKKYIGAAWHILEEKATTFLEV